MTAYLADVLRAEGCKVSETSGWQTRGRPGAYAPFGVLNHHTATASASYSNPNPTLNLCINGRSDLPGPLCQVMIGYDGTCFIVAAGRANHAGSARNSPPIPAGDGNAMMVGFEWDYSGTAPPSPEQYQAAILANAAVLRRMARDSSYAKGHRETSTEGKIDPFGVDLNRMRADIAARIGGGAPPPTPTPSTTGDDNMICVDPVTGGTWCIASKEGAVYTVGPAEYLGATNNDAMNKARYPCVGIGLRPNNDGYRIVLDWGAGKGDQSADGTGTRFRVYDFPRNKSGMVSGGTY